MAMDTTETAASPFGAKKDASVPDDAPVFEKTVAYEAAPAAQLYANRAMGARVKVNSTRQGTPRPYGPWSPGFVARAFDTKSNEVEVPPPSQVGTWPGSVTDTMEYTAFEALGRGVAAGEHDTVDRVPLQRVPSLGPVARSPRAPDEPRPSPMLRDTAPLAPGTPEAEPRDGTRARVNVRTGPGRSEASAVARLPQRAPEGRDAAALERPTEALTVRVDEAQVRASSAAPLAKEAPGAAPAPADHSTEQAVALVLFLFALALVHLIWAN